MRIHFGQIGRYNPDLSPEEHGIDSNRAAVARMLNMPAGTPLTSSLLALGIEVASDRLTIAQARQKALESPLEEAASDTPKPQGAGGLLAVVTGWAARVRRGIPNR